jgi:hypothetical protein
MEMTDLYMGKLPLELTRYLTWELMVEIEPRLNALWLEACTVSSKYKKHFCANSFWYGYGSPEQGFKGRVSKLAGFDAANPKLRGMDAYSIAYEKIYKALPDCRNCGES